MKILIYGLMGLLVECIFTGLWSLFHKNWKATCTSYLWMAPIYGLGALQLEYIHNLSWHPILMALIYLPVIYFNELLWGWAIHKITGKRLWDYGAGRHTLMGYIRWDYAPLWFLLALGFEFFCRLQKGTVISQLLLG